MLKQDNDVRQEGNAPDASSSVVVESAPTSTVFDALQMPGTIESAPIGQSFESALSQTTLEIGDKISELRNDIAAIEAGPWYTKVLGSNQGQLERNLQSLENLTECLQRTQTYSGEPLTPEGLTAIRRALELESISITPRVAHFDELLKDRGLSQECIDDLSIVQKEVITSSRYYHLQNLSEEELIDRLIEDYNLPAIAGGALKVNQLEEIRQTARLSDGSLSPEGLARVQQLENMSPESFVSVDEVRGRIEAWIDKVKRLPVEVTLQDKVVQGRSILETLHDEAVYRNGFVATEASNGKAAEQTKRSVENGMYPALEQGQDTDRPVYAALNPTERPEGCAAYGDITLSFAPSVKDRSFVVAEDSADAMLQGHDVFEADKPAVLLHRYAEGYGLSMIKSLLDLPGSDPLKAGFYPEVHVFGAPRLDRELLGIRAPEATLQEAQAGNEKAVATAQRLQALSEKFNVPIEWY